MTHSFDPAQAAAQLLAIRAGDAPRIPDLLPPPPDTRAAYAVQRAVIGQRSGGAWKMALLGGQARHAGALSRADLHPNGAVLPPLPADACIEVETALILGADLPAGADAEAALAAIGQVHLAFEIVASRYDDRRAVQPLSAMADSFSGGGIVLGDALPDWRRAMAGPLGIALWLDDRPVDAPEAVATLADAVDFLGWLSGHAAAQGMALRRGDTIITGARIGRLALNGATHARARIGGSTGPVSDAVTVSARFNHSS